MRFGLLVLYLSVFGGAIGVFAKMALVAFSPLTIIFFRSAASLVCIAVLLSRQDRLSAAFSLVARHLGKFFILALSGVLMAMVVGFIGLKYTTALNYGLIYNLSSIFIFIFSIFILRQEARRIDVMWILLAFLGAGIIATNGSLKVDLLEPHFLGDFLVLISAIGWALYSVLGAKFSKDVPALDSLVLNFGTFLLATVLLLPIISRQVNWGIDVPAINTISIVGLLGLAILSTTVLFVLWLRFVDKEGGIWATLVSLSENLSGVALPIIFLGERLTFPIFIGGLFMLVSIAGKELGDRYATGKR